MYLKPPSEARARAADSIVPSDCLLEVYLVRLDHFVHHIIQVEVESRCIRLLFFNFPFDEPLDLSWLTWRADLE